MGSLMQVLRRHLIREQAGEKASLLTEERGLGESPFHGFFQKAGPNLQ